MPLVERQCPSVRHRLDNSIVGDGPFLVNEAGIHWSTADGAEQYRYSLEDVASVSLADDGWLLKWSWIRIGRRDGPPVEFGLFRNQGEAKKIAGFISEATRIPLSR